MSIHGSIETWVQHGRLVDVASRWGRRPLRRFYVVPEVLQELETSDALRAASLEEVLAFVEGGRLTYSFSKRPDAVMRRLSPRKKTGQADVWEVRIKQPRPGARIYGLFADLNVFVGTEYAERDQTSADMSEEIKRSQCLWRSLFPNDIAVVSENIHAYLDAHVHQAL